jgi:hypothetical protein
MQVIELGMEIRGKKVYVDGKKVFEHWGDFTHDNVSIIDHSYKPVSFQEYKKRNPDKGDSDYQRDVLTWWAEFKKLKQNKCEGDLMDGLCYSELEEFSPRIAGDLATVIKHRCHYQTKEGYSLYW